MNPRHLWETNLIAAGDHKVIWELLHDLWAFYTSKHNKVAENKIKKSNSSANLKKPSTSILLVEEDIRKPESSIPIKQDNFGYNNYVSLNEKDIGFNIFFEFIKHVIVAIPL